MIVKVCGMRQPDNIRAVEQLPVDWMGFIFYEKSKRYVQTADYLPQYCRRIGVFVDATLADILDHVQRFGLGGIQLHGHETPEFCAELRRSLPPNRDIVLLKAFSIASADDLLRAERYVDVCDYFLFDTPGAGYGGTGQQFDWSLLESYRGETPFLLSGGIGPDSRERLNALHHPRWCGIDLNSRFETAPAVKDVALLRDFLETETKSNEIQ